MAGCVRLVPVLPQIGRNIHPDPPLFRHSRRFSNTGSALTANRRAYERCAAQSEERRSGSCSGKHSCSCVRELFDRAVGVEGCG